MQSDMPSSFERIISGPISRWLRPFTLALAVVFVSGCTERKPPKLPSAVETDLHVLGPDQTFIAGMRVSEVYNSLIPGIDNLLEDFLQEFLNELPDELLDEMRTEIEDFDELTPSELGRKALEQLGIDPERHDLTLYGAYDSSTDAGVPTLLIRAPIPDELLSELEAESEIVNPGDDDKQDEASDTARPPLFSIGESADLLFFTRADEGLLAVSGSSGRLQIMAERASETNTPPGAGLLSLVAGAEFWFVLNELDEASELLASTSLPDEVAKIVSSVDAVAGSVELEEEAIWLSIFFGPKQGIDHRDISDLIGGAIALLKLQIDADLGSDSGDNLDGNRVFLDFLDRIKVSEQGSFSRVQISITSNDMDTLWDSIRSVLSALDLPS